MKFGGGGTAAIVRKATALPPAGEAFIYDGRELPKGLILDCQKPQAGDTITIVSPLRAGKEDGGK